MISGAGGAGQIFEVLTNGPVGSSLAAMLDLDNALRVAIKASHMGREVLLSYFGQLSKVSEKNQAGLVSEADLESERVIAHYLRQEFPAIAIMGEEGTFQNPGQSLGAADRKKGLWLIDPLDGTTNYVHQFPIYCVSIGLEYENELVVAACDVPVFKKTYTAKRGGGAFVENIDGKTKLSVSHRSKIEESLLATGFSTYDLSDLPLQIFGELIRETRGIRRAGSAAYDLCMVAEGIFDGYWERNLSPWDTAAGALIVKEAGGVVTSYDADTYSPFDKSIVAGNPAIHTYLRRKIQSVIK